MNYNIDKIDAIVLDSYNVQCEQMTNNNAIWTKDDVMLGSYHKTKYQDFGGFVGTVGPNKKVTICISQGNPIVGNFDIVLKHKYQKGCDFNIDEIIKSIELELGGQRMERVSLKHMLINSSLLGSFRKIRTFKSGGTDLYTTVVPLNLGFLVDYLVFPIKALYRHEIRINLHFGNFPVEIADLYGHVYMLQNHDFETIISKISYPCLGPSETKYEEFLINFPQTQYTGQEFFDISSNYLKYRLNFIHCVSAIYFYGPGINLHTVKRFRLALNGYDYIDTTPELLLANSLNRGVVFDTNISNSLSPVFVMYFCNGDLKKPDSWINLSRIDNATLFIEFYDSAPDYFQQKSIDKPYINIVAINHQPLKSFDGMGGLMFAM